jgi:hypothetical protein
MFAGTQVKWDDGGTIDVSVINRNGSRCRIRGSNVVVQSLLVDAEHVGLRPEGIITIRSSCGALSIELDSLLFEASPLKAEYIGLSNDVR